MGFLDHLLGRSKVDAELRSLCGKYSHNEFPFLRTGYAPTSRYPAVDFTPWIAQRLAEHRFQDIAYLLVQLTLANPGIGIGSDYWEKKALRLCKANLQEAIDCDDSRAFLDLHAALFPHILHGSLDGFMLLDQHVDFLARVMSPYAFSVHHLETKVDAANKFIRKMRRKTREYSTAWSDYPLLRSEDLKQVLDSTPPASDLRAALGEISIGARQLFFGTLKDGPGQGHWMARPYGIDEEKAAAELVEHGLGEMRDDPSLVLMTYRKGELLAALAGHPTKQGWNRKYIAKYMMENAPEVLASLTEGKKVFALREGIEEEGTTLVDWLSKIKVHLSVALGFWGAG